MSISFTKMSGSGNDFIIIDNRELAIQTAVERAQRGDIITVLGKGHENYQIVGTEKKHFDDKEVLIKYLQ